MEPLVPQQERTGATGQSAGPDTSITYSRLEEQFYRSKFADVTHQLDHIETTAGSLTPEQALVRANTFFELHKVDAAKTILTELSADAEPSPDVLYAAARLAYLDNDHLKARQIFQTLYDLAPSERYQFKALLGLANTYYSEDDFSALPDIIRALLKFEPLSRDDDRISLLLFLGNYCLASGTSTELARDYYKRGLASAAGRTWTYFITRCLYGLACVCLKEEKSQELAWTLELLQSFVNESEQILFTHIVNRKFKDHFAIRTPIEFDPENKRIMIKNSWVPLHDRPMLFRFLHLLHQRDSFVSKGEVATELWPNEDYKPRVHDPRIFDIAKRARQIIEAYENQPAVLLSGRMGYKLASI